MSHCAKGRNAEVMDTARAVKECTVSRSGSSVNRQALMGSGALKRDSRVQEEATWVPPGL